MKCFARFGATFLFGMLLSYFVLNSTNYFGRVDIAPLGPQISQHLLAENLNDEAGSTGGGIQIDSRVRSYFELDENGRLKIKPSGKRYEVLDNLYTLKSELKTDRTALIVMDPWQDSGSSFLNNYYLPILREKITPLVAKALELRLNVIILTNDPDKISQNYGSAIYSDLEELAKQEKIKVLYHQDYTDVSFDEYLKSQSVDSLIYAGFASNMCVIGRELGMIPMKLQGYRLFFIPEASAAVEFRETWRTGEIHQWTTMMISQWVANILKLSDFLQISSAEK